MRKLATLIMVALACLWLTATPSLADGEHGSKEEAKAMAEKAAAFLKTQGKDKAFETFTQGGAGFKNRDLYVFVYNDEGVCQAIGSNPAMVGKKLIDMKDSDGKPLIREFIAVKDAAWVDYKWRNPQTQEILPKSSYIIRVGDYVLGVGAYVFH